MCPTMNTMNVQCFSVCIKLKELWIVNATEATDVKIREECQPGKPVPVFSETTYKVSFLRHAVQQLSPLKYSPIKSYLRFQMLCYGLNKWTYKPSIVTLDASALREL